MIKEISIKDINEYYSEAKKSGLTFCKSATLYGLFVGNKLVAFTGIIIMRNKAIFKNHFVPVQNRGNGFFKILLDFSIELVKSHGIKTIEATCTGMSINEYKKRGFCTIKQYKFFTRVRNENI